MSSLSSTSIKQVIIVRKDLKLIGLSVGKLAAHVAHGAVEGFLNVQKIDPNVVRRWILHGQKKIVLVVKDLNELLDRYKRAKSLGVPAVIIRDAGLTEIPAGTITVLVLGPWFEDKIDKVSRDLPLLKDW